MQHWEQGCARWPPLLNTSGGTLTSTSGPKRCAACPPNAASSNNPVINTRFIVIPFFKNASDNYIDTDAVFLNFHGHRFWL